MSKYLTDSGLSTLWALIKNLVNNLDEKTVKSLSELGNGIFVGTNSEYEAANAAGNIPVGTIVIITDDLTNNSSTTAVLGTAKLGYMILE